MADSSMLDKVKADLGIGSNTAFDTIISGYINDVQQILLDAGVDQSIVQDVTIAGGVIFRGVADMWNVEAGTASLSPYFWQRAAQLVYKKPLTGGGSGG